MSSSSTVTIDVVADTTSAVTSINKLSSSIGKTLAAAATVAASAIAAIGEQSLEAYSEYEQLAEAIEITFGDYAGEILENANNAYATAQVSAITYLESVSSFGNLLLNSLDGDTAAATEYIEIALSDMADIANTFGLDMDEVSDVYKSLSRGIYRTLDNLQLGYNGSQAGLEALIEDANEYAETMGLVGDLTADSYADIIQAIHYIVQQKGYEGVAAYEVTETLQGSLNALSAVWENWLLGLASEDYDLTQLTENLVWALENVASNVLPRIQQIAQGLANSFPQLVSDAWDTLAPIVEEAIAGIWNTISGFLNNSFGIDLGTIDTTDIEEFVDTLAGIFQDVYGVLQEVVDAVSPIVSSLIDAIVPAFEYIVENLDVDGLVDTIGGALQSMYDTAEPIITWITDTVVPAVVDFVNSLDVEDIESIGIVALISTLASKLTGSSGLSGILSSFDFSSFFKSFSSGVTGTGGLISILVGFFSELSSVDLSSFTSGISGVFGSITSIVASGDVSSLFSSATIVSIKDFFSALLSGSSGASGVLSVFKSLSSFFTSAAPIILLVVTALGALALAFTEGYESSETFRNIVDAIPEVLGNVLSTLGSAILEYLPQALAALSDVLWQIVDWVLENGPSLLSQAVSFLGEIATIFATYLPSILGAVGAIIGELIAYVIAEAPNLLAAAVTLMTGFIDGIISMGAGIVTGFLAGVETLYEEVCSFFEGVFNNIIDFVKGIFGIASPSTVFEEIGDFLVQGLIEGIDGAVSGLMEMFGSVKDSVTEFFTDAVDWLFDSGSNLLQGLIDGVSNMASSAVETVTGVASDIIGGVKDFFGIASPSTVFAGIGENLMTGLQNGIDSGSGDADSEAAAAAEALTSTMTTAISALSASMNELTSTMMTTMSTTITAMTSSIGSSWSTAWNSVSSSMSTVWSGMLTTLTSSTKSMLSAVKSIKSSITGCFSDASSWLSSAGTNIISGLTNSIKKGLSSVTSTIKNLCTSAISAAKSALGIASPSKVFAEIGDYLMEGLANGVDESADEAISAVEGVADSLASAIDVGALDIDVGYSAAANLQTVGTDALAATKGYTVNQTFETKVVRADSDLYTAAPILYRSAMRTAALA